MTSPRSTCGICGVPLAADEMDDGICDDCRSKPTDLEGLLQVALAAADAPDKVPAP